MAQRRVARYVHVNGRVYAPGDVVSDEDAKLIRNPSVWQAEDDGQEDTVVPGPGQATPTTTDPAATGGAPAQPQRPAKSATKDAWRTYLENDGVPPAELEGKTRDELIALADQRERPE
ncbi:hypothetical protein [Nonomuraea aridisoli]|uniref:Uncharacterized protein n=1 Tax=Nonomuraea aridisoli TaxID=2070368 RepID=A0A2W2EDL9_9ACTN|nr:hypothetical protein [Nonomuraea aridisoli]PZG20603.1 hypothetical protein C1J01_08860 [Nonomuraea aridisoli]